MPMFFSFWCNRDGEVLHPKRVVDPVEETFIWNCPTCGDRAYPVYFDADGQPHSPHYVYPFIQSAEGAPFV